jgi:hypothetical protein
VRRLLLWRWPDPVARRRLLRELGHPGPLHRASDAQVLGRLVWQVRRGRLELRPRAGEAGAVEASGGAPVEAPPPSPPAEPAAPPKAATPPAAPPPTAPPADGVEALLAAHPEAAGQALDSGTAASAEEIEFELDED